MEVDTTGVLKEMNHLTTSILSRSRLLQLIQNVETHDEMNEDIKKQLKIKIIMT